MGSVRDVSPVVEVEHLSKSYSTGVLRRGRSRGVDDVSFVAHRGDVVGLLGPNGSGKTTIIRTLLGLLRPTGGTARVFGADVAGADPAWRARTGYVPGEPGLYGTMRVGEFLDLLAGLRGGAGARRRGELCERLGLRTEGRIAQLSKGTRQKVALVQAFMHDPDLLVLDEPTSGLDPIVQREFDAMIDECRARGATVLLSSHVMAEVERLASRVAVVHEGRLALVDDMEALRARAPRRLDLEFAAPVPASALAGVDGVRGVVAAARTVLSCRVVGSEGPLLRAALDFGLVGVQSREQSLEEVFLSVVDGSS